MQRMNRWLAACAMGVLLSACADHPPAVIENRSTTRVDVAPEVRQSMPSERPSAPSEQVVNTDLPQGPDYRVQQGDTLYSVAFRLGMDYRTLAQFNEIDPPFTILVGESLRTVSPVPQPQPSRGSAAKTTVPKANTPAKPVPRPTTVASRRRQKKSRLP